MLVTTGKEIPQQEEKIWLSHKNRSVARQNAYQLQLEGWIGARAAEADTKFPGSYIWLEISD
jgi:hypothetical protein